MGTGEAPLPPTAARAVRLPGTGHPVGAVRRTAWGTWLAEDAHGGAHFAWRDEAVAWVLHPHLR